MIILYIFLFLCISYAVGLTVWAYFLIAMKLKWANDRNKIKSKFLRFNAYLLLSTGAPIYIFLNVFVATILFLNFPREWQFTKRCRRYIKGETGWFEITRKWRKKAAMWICRVLLDPFDDPDTGHC